MESSHRFAGLSILGVLLACSSSSGEPPLGAGPDSGGFTSSGGASSGGQATATGGPGPGSGGTTGAVSGSGGTGGAGLSSGGTGGAGPASGGTGGVPTPVDCSGITAAGYELCASSPSSCEAVFTDGAGCDSVCAAAGLSCASALENLDGACAAQTDLPAVPCNSGHGSDYCVCSGSSTGTGGTGGATGGVGGAGGGAAGTGGASGGGGSGTGGSGGSPGVVGQPIGFATLNGGTTGGKGGQTVTVDTLAELQQYAEADEPYVILVDGTISNGSTGARVQVKSNKSIVGLGDGAFLSGVGISISSRNNVILQNLKLTLVGTSNPSSVNGGDAIVINGTSKNVWIDHCELYSEDPTVQTDIDKYDGLIDIRDQTGFITVSWNYIHDHHKGCLVGASDTDLHADRKITYHHNYFQKIVKRMPMYRGAVGHFFNNYVVGTPATEATFVLMGTCLRVEKNLYENVKYSIYSQTGETAGSAQRIDNIESQSRAYPASCTADIPYDYGGALTTNTADVKNVVQAGAGVGKL